MSKNRNKSDSDSTPPDAPKRRCERVYPDGPCPNEAVRGSRLCANCQNDRDQGQALTLADGTTLAASIVPVPQAFAGSAISGLELNQIPTPELRAELARGLTLTADTLYRLGLIWQELEHRGEDLSSLRTGLARTLPLIAAGLLAAEAVVAFAGRPAVLLALEGVPLERQRRLAAGEAVEAIDPTNPAHVITEPIVRLPTAAVRLAIADGTVRTPDVQRLAFRPRKRRREESSYRYRPRYDRETGTITVGRMAVALDDLLRELSSAAGPDNVLLHADPEQYVHVKVRLTREEADHLTRAALRAELPDWELIRKAMRAWGLI